MAVKINFRLHIAAIFIVFFLPRASTFAQDTTLNKYGLWVINDVKTLALTSKGNPGKRMADVNLIPGIAIDLRYATVNNFMHKQLYPSTKTTYLRYDAVAALQQVEKELNKTNLGLKIFDAYRPYSVTEAMWEPIKDDRYVADPKKGSGHNRGIAVDLTIINLKTKKELDMGTGFDNFSDTAHHSFTNLPKEILDNRTLLKTTMEKYGFKYLETEWWHYSLPNATNYELLDVSFKKIIMFLGKELR